METQFIGSFNKRYEDILATASSSIIGKKILNFSIGDRGMMFQVDEACHIFIRELDSMI